MKFHLGLCQQWQLLGRSQTAADCAGFVAAYPAVTAGDCCLLEPPLADALLAVLAHTAFE